MSLYKLIIILLCGLILTACNQQHATKNEPQLNPHPKYFVTISGTINPHLKHMIYYLLRSTYGAYNPKCKVWVNHFEGVKGIPGHTEYYPAKHDANGHYVVKIPIDRYKPGKCNWKIARISYTFSDNPIPQDKKSVFGRHGDLIACGHYGHPQELPGIPILNKVSLYHCGSGGFNQCNGNTLSAGYNNSVPRNKSYHFIQDIKN